jgi:hypothetical protein
MGDNVTRDDGRVLTWPQDINKGGAGVERGQQESNLKPHSNQESSVTRHPESTSSVSFIKFKNRLKSAKLRKTNSFIG